MIQDIKPHQFNNEFKHKTPKKDDYLLIFKDDSLMMNRSNDSLNFTKFGQITELNPNITDETIYLFSVDETSIFCTFESVQKTEKFEYCKIDSLRSVLPSWMLYIVATANHLASWYSTNKFCGRCAVPMEFSKTERALCCPKCGLIRYPHINPAVIIGIIDNDKILLTRYADRPYKKLSLVAGYTEIGETLEDTINREVMEEVGLKVKNIQYYKSQPWAFSESLLMGFFAELDGLSDVKIDNKELSEATWYRREEISECESTISLTNEMIELFRNNKINNYDICEI